MQKCNLKKHSNNGFTLVELMIVLSLLGVVLAIVYNFFFFSTNSFSKSDAQARVLQQMNLFSSKIASEIRSAQEPNGNTNAVVIKTTAGDSIGIYWFNSNTKKYECIEYRLLSTDKSKLQRGSVSCTTATLPTVANPDYGSITNWQIVVDGVKNVKDVKLFNDITSVADSDRRTIELNISADDVKLSLPKPVTIYTVMTSRSVSPKK